MSEGWQKSWRSASAGHDMMSITEQTVTSLYCVLQKYYKSGLSFGKFEIVALCGYLGAISYVKQSGWE